MDFSIRITGEAGQGMETIGGAFCEIIRNIGHELFSNKDYMSRVRGGNNYYQVRIADKRLYTLKATVDIIVCLDKDSVLRHKQFLNPEGIIVVDCEKFKISEDEKSAVNILDVPMHKMANDAGGKDMYVNSVALGLLSGMLRIDFDEVRSVVEKAFKKKDQEVIDINVKAAKSGYDFGREKYQHEGFSLEPREKKPQMLINGNEAIGLGAIAAGCRFYTAYPMTPATSILTTMTKYGDKFGVVVEQAEDELAAINMAIGASYAGVRSMTGTSGGGFALMGEGVSLAGMTETPVVIANSQRPGPATGLPTRTAQGDLELALFSGHGEFARAVFAPGTTEEAFYLTIKAFNLAEKYQIPVIILTDQHLADSVRNLPPFDINAVKVERSIISRKDSGNVKEYKRYQITDSGISPRAVPSWIEDVIYADSDEHSEQGHIIEDGETRNKMLDKRYFKRMELLAKEVQEPVSENLEKASVVLVGFGSTFGVLKEMVECDENIGLIHLPQVWPFPLKKFQELTRDKTLYTVEGNGNAQLAHLIRRETGITVDNCILRYDGRPFDIDFLTEKIQQLGGQQQ